MFKQDKELQDRPIPQSAPETVIGKSVVVTGDLTADGDVVIEGELNGSLITKGSVKIGAGAVINANIEAKTGVIAGTVTGKIVVHGFLELLPTASIKGDVSTEQIAISQGANVNGAITMTTRLGNHLEEEPAIVRKNR